MDFLESIHPERNVDNFTKNDGTVKFYSFVRAAMLRTDAKVVMDFGAGRGQFWHRDSEPNGSLYRRHLQSLKFNMASVYACDIDPAVLDHPCSDRQIILKPGESLPFENGKFDVIVSDWTFEHIDDPEYAAKELIRVLKSGGFICARTTNRFGYLNAFASLIPNKYHAPFLRLVQPGRKSADVFPTHYRLNSVRKARRHFSGCDVFYYRDSSDPAYYFGSPVLYRIFQAIHGLLPSALSVTICFFIKKR